MRISDPWGTRDLGEMSVKCWCEGTTADQSRIVVLYVCMCVVYVGAPRRTLSLLKICPWSMQNAAPCAEKLKLWAQRLAFFAKYNTEKLGGSLNKMNSFERKNVLQ